MAYSLSKQAAEDFANIYEYSLLQFGVYQADYYTDGLHHAFALLASSPFMGIKCPEITSELFRHNHQRHVIFYRTASNGNLFIVRILHQQMDAVQYLNEPHAPYSAV